MEDMKDRLKQLRKKLNMTQTEFAKKLGITHATISDIERGKIKEVTERNVKIICSEFNVNEIWLRTGEGNMFNDNKNIAFDEYIKSKEVSDLEIEIIKAYLELDPEVRKSIIQKFMTIFSKDSLVGNSIYKKINNNEVEFSNDNDIEKELERYKLELLAEKKGKTSLASQNINFKETKKVNN